MNNQKMTRSPQELADTFEAALAAHVPASQTAEWEGWEPYLGLVALAEAGERANLGLATTSELIEELHARADVAQTIGEKWPGYRTVDS